MAIAPVPNLVFNWHVDCSLKTSFVLVGYQDAGRDWPAPPQDDLMTDLAFADLLAAVLSSETSATIPTTKHRHTEAYRLGYAFGLARALLVSVVARGVRKSVLDLCSRTMGKNHFTTRTTWPI